MEIDKLKNYFRLENANDVLDLNKIEKCESIFISQEVKSLYQQISKFESIYLPFFIETPDSHPQIHHYTWFELFTIPEIIQNIDALKFLEKEAIKWYEGCNGYDASELIPIASISGDSDIDKLYLNCGKVENGSIYAFDARIYCELNKDGYPLKIKISDSLTDLINLSESIRTCMPKEFLLAD